MEANPILLQKKYTRIISLFAKKNQIDLDQALDIFYKSDLYSLIHNGISDMHTRSDDYLVEELQREYKKKESTNIM